jgi:preprotein translocase subunit SecF
MLRLFANANYDFIRVRRYAYAVTALFILPGVLFLLIKGLNYSIEFTGGTLMQLRFTRPANIGEIRQVVSASGHPGAEIQQFGSDRDFTVRAKPRQVQGGTATAAGGDAAAREIERGLKQHFGAQVSVVRSEFVGPRVGEELRRNATIAMLISFAITLVYLAIRFEWRFGLAAVLATAHDILTTFAFLAIMRLEVSLTVVAAILTVIGYSLNDTIIIFDRVRENLRKQRRESFRQVLNRSINETLPRSVLTHATTTAATLALLLFAGEVIRPFAWVMTFGIVTGTFSSIYVAGVLLLYIETRWPRAAGEAKGTARALAAEKRRQAGVGQTVGTR